MKKLLKYLLEVFVLVAMVTLGYGAWDMFVGYSLGSDKILERLDHMESKIDSLLYDCPCNITDK